MFTKSNYNVSILEEVSYFIENVFESLELKDEIPNVKKFICVSLYKPPGCKFAQGSANKNSRSLPLIEAKIFFHTKKMTLKKLEVGAY